MFNKVIQLKVGDKFIEDLQIDFNVTLDKDEENEATITVSNLTKATREEIKEDDPVELISGYEGQEAIIFTGQVKTNDLDIKTSVKSKLRCVDKDFSISRSYSKAMSLINFSLVGLTKSL